MTGGLHGKNRLMGNSLLDILVFGRRAAQSVKDNLQSSMKNMIHNSKNHLFRILHYPPVPKGPTLGSIRAHQHEDINLITLLVAGSRFEIRLRLRDLDKQDGHL